MLLVGCSFSVSLSYFLQCLAMSLLFAVMALIMWPAAAQDFKEGVHYEVIAETATAKPEAIEFFF